jgi:predicted helicase
MFTHQSKLTGIHALAVLKTLKRMFAVATCAVYIDTKKKLVVDNVNVSTLDENTH